MIFDHAKQKPGFWRRQTFCGMSFGALAGRRVVQLCNRYWPAEHTLRLRQVKTGFEPVVGSGDRISNMPIRVLGDGFD